MSTPNATTQKPPDQTTNADPKVETPSEEPQLTEAELAEQTKRTMEALGFTYHPKEKPVEEKPKETPPPKKEEEPPKADDKAKPETPKPEPKTEKPKVPKAAAPAAVDEQAIADRVADRLKKDLTPPQPAKPEEPPQPETPQLSDKDKRDRQVFTVLAETPKYKRIVEDFDAFIPMEAKYRKDWERSNPGKSFDPEDEEHQEFYDKNEPRFDMEDFTDAKIELVAREKFEAADRKRQEKENYERLVTDTSKKLEKTKTAVVQELIQEMDEQFKEVASVDDLKAKDPAAAYVVRAKTNQLQSLATELDLIMTPKLGYAAKQDNPVHQDLIKRMYDYENELAQYPAESTTWNGRKFTLIEDYLKMGPEQQKRHWTMFLEPDKVKKMLVADFASEARRELADLRPAKPADKEKPSSPATPTPEPPNLAEVQADGVAQQFPNSGGAAGRTPVQGVSAEEAKKDSEKIMSVLFPV